MKKQLITILGFALALVSVSGQETPAFPGAEGFGKYTTGGRGGRVIEVTTLEDKDRFGAIPEGSFRAALNTEGVDPITIVFRISGIIELNGELKSGRSNMTIAGQTAPGDGICIKDASVKLSGDNLIIRYMRFRPGDETQEEVSALNIENAKNIIVDHCSFSWSIEENVGFYDNHNTTIQWCILSEPLYDSYHKKGPRGYGSQWGGQYASYHHNLIACSQSRSPRVNGSRSHDTVALFDFRNNVIYNWGRAGAIYGGEQEIYAETAENPGVNIAGSYNNFINNYYKPGPGTGTPWFAAPSYVTDGNTAYGYGQWYLSGNIMEGNPRGLNDNNNLGVDGSDVGNRDNVIVDTEHEITEAAQVTTETAEEALASVIANAGATKPVLDDVDKRVFSYLTGSADPAGTGIIDSQSEVGGWPTYNTPANENIPVDTDKDGIPDTWESANGLNPNDAEDGKTITASGYSNLELYLNSDIEYIPGVGTAVSTITISKGNFYPNPATDMLNFSDNSKVEEVKIFDTTGKMVFQQKTKDGNDTLNISHLNTGMYLVKAYTTGRKLLFIEKICKK